MNIELLNKTIDESGLKRSYIARSIGLTEKVFHDRTSGITQWKLKEIVAFCLLLRLSKRLRDNIFFTEM